MSRDAIAALPLIQYDNQWHIVLVTGRDSDTWIIPKGNPEKRMSSREVAGLEAYEEAGVMGKVKPTSLTAKCRPTGNSLGAVIHLIVDHVLKKWPEKGERRVIFPVAIKRLRSKRGPRYQKTFKTRQLTAERTMRAQIAKNALKRMSTCSIRNRT